MSIRAITCGFLAVILIASGETGSGRADSRRGEWFAEKWCSQCHAMNPNQISANPAAPRFSDLAANPSISDASLRAFLNTTPHWSMPKFKLKSNDLNDVIGYILSPRSLYGGR
jgi:mono/diheme cytochrome c family protein